MEKLLDFEPYFSGIVILILILAAAGNLVNGNYFSAGACFFSMTFIYLVTFTSFRDRI